MVQGMVQGSAEANLLGAALYALGRGEEILWTDHAEPQAFRRAALARGRLWRAARFLFFGPFLGSFFFVTVRDLVHRPPQLTLANLLWLCLLFSAVSFCAAMVWVAIMESVAWSARTGNVLYVVTNRRLLLVGPTAGPFRKSIGRNLLPGDLPCDRSPIALPPSETAGNVVVRTLNPIIGAAPCSGASTVTLFHHDYRDEDGIWHHHTSTIPAVREPKELCMHINRMSQLAQTPCPRTVESGGAGNGPGCECMSDWPAARQFEGVAAAEPR